MDRTTAIVHGVIVLGLVAAYVVVTVTGHDGTPLLGVLGGYASGAAAPLAITAATRPGSP